MLSKLLHYDKPALQVCHNLAFEELKLYMVESGHSINLVECRPGGTLGVFSYAEIDGVKKFIKTHLPGEDYRLNVLKEIQILKCLYNDVLSVEQKELKLNGINYSFLIMDFLEENTQFLSLKEVQNSINNYTEKLTQIDAISTINGMYNLNQIYDEAARAIPLLVDNNLLSQEVAARCSDHLSYIKEIIDKSKKVVCHGDLSNKNILRLNNQPIIIDWEDSFIGIEDYDLCYWLSFFDQKQYHNSELFRLTQISPNNLIAFMVLIVLAKCWLSYKNHSYKSNIMSFNQRLTEILSIN